MAEAATPQRLAILIVDDEEPILELLESMLQDAGHTVHLARNGRQALAFLKVNGAVDIVLSDINMPLMDGMELQREIRTRFPNLPILLTSGRPPPTAMRNFLPKPFRWDALAAALIGLMGNESGFGRA